MTNYNEKFENIRDELGQRLVDAFGDDVGYVLAVSGIKDDGSGTHVATNTTTANFARLADLLAQLVQERRYHDETEMLRKLTEKLMRH